MFNSVQLVRDICKQKSIPIAKLEKDCGFANGYLNPKKQTKLPYDRAIVIAEYLDVSPDYILTGEQKNTPAESDKRADIKLSQVERELILKFRHLDDRGKATILNALEYEYQQLTGEKTKPLPRQA